MRCANHHEHIAHSERANHIDTTAETPAQSFAGMDRRKILLIGGFIGVAFIALFLNWTSSPPDHTSDKTVVYCSGFFTNSNGEFASFVISNGDSRTVGIIDYYAG